MAGEHPRIFAAGNFWRRVEPLVRESFGPYRVRWTEEPGHAVSLTQEELKNGVYATPGGRVMLARDAASNLKFRQVILNSNDPRVPSLLDLDALVSTLLGEEP